MQWERPLVLGKLERRYKRFLADVRLENGLMVTAHCPNSGSMKGLAEPGMAVALSFSERATRRLPYTLELVAPVEGTWVGVNTMHPNRLVMEALPRLPEFQGYDVYKREVRVGDHTRLDFCLEGKEGLCYMEVKNVTLKEGERALFPDAVTERGLKHLKVLEGLAAMGHRASMFYLVQRSDCRAFDVARDIDPAYARGLEAALKQGVEVVTYGCHVSLEGISLTHPLKKVENEKCL